MMVNLPGTLGARLAHMPWVHRILAENLLRRSAVDADADHAAQEWLERGNRTIELPFVPARLLMHDTTCGPALVDLAAMRSVVAAEGGDPRRILPGLRVDVSTDHSIAVDSYGARGALEANLAAEMARNAERFGLMKWAGNAFPSLHVHPPGTGIMHTINLERLATVVSRETWQGRDWLFPDTLIGTDSHTPMINGIGVLGWGVGGLEAESVMLGMPVTLRVPEVVGVRLTGRLRPGVTATDLALTITQMLRGVRIDGRFVEFFGAGVSTLSAGTRAVVANMAPEFGGATGYFPPDEAVIAYLRATGRASDHIRQVGDYLRRQKLWFDPDAAPDYDLGLHLDLGSVVPSLAGPHRPQDRIARAETSASAERRPVALAAITSCTNTSDPRLLVTAGLVARAALARGLSVPRWVKTSLAPGSPTAAALLERAGLREALEALGFAIVAYGCTTCIGNSGPLSPEMDALIAEGAHPIAVLSGNRNFPGRVHQAVRDSYLAAPPLVIAYALAGDFSIAIETDPLGTGSDGTHVFLRDIWPAEHEIDRALAAAANPADFEAAYAAAEANADWAALPASDGPLFPWDQASTYLRPPPFVALGAQSRLGRYAAYPLLVLCDDITTDHISPAGAIPAQGDAGRWLIERGERADDLNVFSARRGNWEVMLRGLFTNPSVRNHIGRDIPPGSTIHVPSGEVLPLWEAAARYAAEGQAVVVVAGDRYGMGSSRDWAAKGQYLLGVRAVLAAGFERIHRSNLCNMGILPLELPAALSLASGDRIEIDMPEHALAPSAPCAVRVLRANGDAQALTARAAVETQAEVRVLKAGGLLPLMLRASLTAS
ncbi:aconitate hydratase [Sphingosinicella microcystinivorans]|uniref:Aconitate hydratase A n=2 Tax=Sphingosinicella microcystinivorans TaxID=335406 RepID=A0AAD1G0C4_SPHMI|nr:aconitate hydratase AcnA [Sphingosinicella microcystinivorans]RKS90606.1 aconitase [Sphingosinicella microcystinivorans]BBE33520.1 aconitate hydratase [Sphingosinicella microcystinivorans]